MSVSAFGRSLTNSYRKLPVEFLTYIHSSPLLHVQSRNNGNASACRGKSRNFRNKPSNVANYLDLTRYYFPNNKHQYCTTCDKDENSLEDNVRYKYHVDVEKAINKQIVSELSAAYSYLNMACYFGRTSIGLLGTRKFFTGMYKEEIEHAMAFIDYQEMRGGHVHLTAIHVGNCGEQCTIQKALELAISMEKGVSDQLSQILALATKHHDIRTEDFITTDFMKEQVQSIRNLGNMLATAIRMHECGLSQYMLDKALESADGHRSKS